VSGDRTNGRWHRLWNAIRQVKTEMTEDNLTLVAAGVAFYAVLALLPALIALVNVYALVVTPEQASEQIQPLLAALPSDAASLLQRQLQKIVQANHGGLTIGLIVSLFATWWAAAGGVSALITGLNIIYEAKESRNFLRLRVLAMGLTLGALVAAVVALALVAAFPVILHRVGLDPAVAVGAEVARWAVLVVLVMLGLSVLYRFGPNRAHTRWRPVTLGATIAVLLWALASAGFSFYVSHFGSYDKTYGSLAGGIVLMLWMYLSAFAVLLGAQIDSVRATRYAAAEAAEAARAVTPTAVSGASDTEQRTVERPATS